MTKLKCKRKRMKKLVNWNCFSILCMRILSVFDRCGDGWLTGSWHKWRALFVFICTIYLSFGRCAQIDFRLMALSLWCDMWPALQLKPTDRSSPSARFCLDFPGWTMSTSIFETKIGDKSTTTTTDGGGGGGIARVTKSIVESLWRHIVYVPVAYWNHTRSNQRYMDVHVLHCVVYRFQFTCCIRRRK